jgi:hypothetical protein
VIASIFGAFKLVPRWIWYLLAAALAWHFALAWHAGRVKAHDRDVIATRDAYWNARIVELAEKAQRIRIDAEARAAEITEKVRSNNESQARVIASDAGALRVRGPGQAAATSCRSVDHPGLPATASGARADGGLADDAGPAVPSSDRATVPWRWLVNRAEQSDLNRAEVIAWRDWYQAQAAAWANLRAQP